MHKFENNQRVQITESQHGLKGYAGTVKRLRIADHGAWVRMDDDLPTEYRSFPADDEEGRGRDLILYPEQCTALG